MNYDLLDQSNWQTQISRVNRLLRNISQRSEIANGRVVPAENDLVIGSGRRIAATVMFIDISDFTKRPSATSEEQERVLIILYLFLTEMIYVIEDYQGVVEKNTGDGLMAYFDDRNPFTPGGNSLQRAVACALTMHAVNDDIITPILTSAGVAPIQFRISMDHGAITVARIGAPLRFNANVAIGNTANFAAHMLEKINSNVIALGHSAYRRLPNTWSQWAMRSVIATGWIFIESRQPYPLYLYSGRWNR